MNTPTPAPQPPKAQSPANPPSSHRTPVLASIIATILLASIGLTIYQLKQKLARQPSGSPTPTVTRNVSPTPESNQSTITTVPSNWKMHQDETNGYSVNYPPQWNLEENVNYLGPESPNYGFIFEKKQEFMPGIAIFVVPKTTPKEWISGLDQYGNIKSININGNKGVEVVDVPGALLQKWIFLDKENKTIIIYASGDEKDFPVFDQIISSFKLPTSDPEKLLIDSWLEEHNLNQYGDPKDTMYPGGTPLFDERTGERTDRYDYIVKKYPERPWNQ